MSPENPSQPPDALMLLGTDCPHCPSVLNELTTLLKRGTIGTLKIINIEKRPDLAKEIGVRTVPWVRLGAFELEGLYPAKELEKWAKNAGSAAGMVAWLEALLANGTISKATRLVQSSPDAMPALLVLFADPDIQLNIRIGISAIMEELQGSNLLKKSVKRLGALTRNEDTRIRGDACYYLALSGDQQAHQYITPLLEDPDSGTRELAKESIEMLEDLRPG